MADRTVHAAFLACKHICKCLASNLSVCLCLASSSRFCDWRQTSLQFFILRSAQLQASSLANVLCGQLAAEGTAVELTYDVCLQAIGEHLRLRPELLPQILTTLFEIVLFEDCANQWSMSRPMLSLILLNEQIYNKLQHQIIASQPVILVAISTITGSSCMSNPATQLISQ